MHVTGTNRVLFALLELQILVLCAECHQALNMMSDNEEESLIYWLNYSEAND